MEPKQKALHEASGVATPQVNLSREDAGKIPSPNSGVVAPRANLILMSEATNGVANTTPVPQGTRGVPNRQTRTKAPSSANHLRTKEADKAPQCAPFSSRSSTKLALRSGAKGSSLSVDSGAYAASAPKDIPKVLSREARGKALLSSANHLCGDEKNRASFYAQSNRNSALNRLSPAGFDLREFLTSKQKSESF